jgi:GGDEF domain-containing protein
MFKCFVVFIFLIISVECFSADFLNQPALAISLNRFSSYQQRNLNNGSECRNKSLPMCPDILSQLVRDDKKDRALIIESRSEICQRALKKNNESQPSYQTSSYYQKLYEDGRFNYLGQYSNDTVRSCIQNNTVNELDQVAKFYYYNSRLNQAAGKVSQERTLIAQLLKSSPPTCPPVDILDAANKVCEQVKACGGFSDLKQFSKNIEKDEVLYNEIIGQLKALPKDCENTEVCKSDRANLSLSMIGLVQLNPWFLDSKFMDSKKNLSLENRLKNYLVMSDKNLLNFQKKLTDSAICLHGGVASQKCELDDMREVLSLTPERQESYTGDKDENKLSTMLTVQSCLEEGSLDRNRVGKIMKDTYWNIGLTVGTLGLGAVANSTRLAAAGVYARMGQIVAESANLSFDVYAAAHSLNDTIQTCRSDEVNFQFIKLEDKDVCKNTGSALSPAQRVHGSCLVSAGFSAFSGLVLLPGGSRLSKIVQDSGYLKSNPVKNVINQKTAQDITQKTAAEINEKIQELKKSGKIRKEDIKRPLSEYEESTPAKALTVITATSVHAQVVKQSEAILNTIPHVPENIKITRVENKDGTKGLLYSFDEKLPNGEWVKNTKELPIDSISGGINANFLAGRELFEKIAKEKASKAYVAFIDVGSLGAVNKTFKAGDAAGDRYLKAVAEKIMKNGEGKITLARLGGDEFGLIIDEADPKKVKIILEKIQTDLRLDLAGDAKKVFREEKIIRADEYKAAMEKLIKENPNGVTEAQKLALRKDIDELARVQQPDISIGSAQIGQRDSLPELLERAENQAKKMKTETALQFGRSAEKYGSNAVPRAQPNPMFRADVQTPLGSSSWGELAGLVERPAGLQSVRDLKFMRKEEIKKFGSTTIAKYEDEAGRASYRVEKYVIDKMTGQKTFLFTEIPTRGNTGLLDGVHPESQKLIVSHIKNATDTMLVMPKLPSLKYLNYFEGGTRTGDEMLEVVSDVLKKTMRTSDLTFKLNGADFLMSLNHTSAENLLTIQKKINEQILENPKVQKILQTQQKALTAKIIAAQKNGDVDNVKVLQNKLIELKNFKPELSFSSLTQAEAKKTTTFKEMIEKLEDKFK